MLAHNLWISRSSWSANNFAFIAAAERPALAASLTFSTDSGVVLPSFRLHEPCTFALSSETKRSIPKKKITYWVLLKGWGKVVYRQHKKQPKLTITIIWYRCFSMRPTISTTYVFGICPAYVKNINFYYKILKLVTLQKEPDK